MTKIGASNVTKILLGTLFILTMVWVACKEQNRNDSQAEQQKAWEKPPVTAWTYTTKGGMLIQMEQSTREQYELRWNGEGFYFNDIDWEVLDEIFYAVRDYYVSLGWNVSGASYQAKVYIKPWDDRCHDAENLDQPYEISEVLNSGQDGCQDGWSWHGWIYFHLGDDPGQGHWFLPNDGRPSVWFDAFMETAFPHEVKHFFQVVAGLPNRD